MSSFIAGDDRQQTWLLPQSLEDYVSADNPVRFVEAFVDQLDFTKAGLAGRPADTGRPGYAPADLLKLYLYGYLNRVRSSRELERLTHRNLEVIWLLKRLRPDHKTISEFRRANRAAFKQVLRQFNLLCRELKLFGAQLVAIDGSFFKAVNSKARNFTRAKLEGLLKAVDAGIEKYLKELELGDAAQDHGAPEAGKARAAGLAEKIKGLRAAKQRHEQMLAVVESDPAGQVSLTDADARLMKKSDGKEGMVAYNVQSAVDAENHLIVDIEATTHPVDRGRLAEVAQRAKEELQVAELTVVADGGYYSGADMKAAEAQGIRVHVPAPCDSMEKAGLHRRDQFHYDAAQDVYECPAGEKLTRHADSNQHGRTYQVYYNTAACAACAQLGRCTTGKYRKVRHDSDGAVMEKIKQRMKEQPELYARRKGLVEHPFGTLKFWWGHAAFLTRGKEAVNAEISLSALAYNLKRAIAVLGVPSLLAHLGMGKVQTAS